MAVIHIELNLVCLVILGFIVYLSLHKVSQHMSRVLFRYFVYGVMLNLFLDILWVLVEGKSFAGAYELNELINAVFLTCAVLFGGLWYLYCLEVLGHPLTRRTVGTIAIPVVIYAALNFLSMWTGWMFYITPDNHYQRGPWFLLQIAGSGGIVLLPLFHIVKAMISPGPNRYTARRLLYFYIFTVGGFLLTVSTAGMPGTWNWAAVSVALLYMDEQDKEIQRDTLTGLNNRKMLEKTFSDYIGQVCENQNLYIFMFDLDHFKQINDTCGHTVGDEVLKDAAKLLQMSLKGQRGFLARYGGDEFLFMGFFADTQAADEYRAIVVKNYEEYNRQGDRPYRLMLSCGYARYSSGDSLEDVIAAADKVLYEEKRGKSAERPASL